MWRIPARQNYVRAAAPRSRSRSVGLRLANDFGVITMGGLGSGNWHRQRAYATVNAFPELLAIDFIKPSGEVIAKPRDELERREVAFQYLRHGREILLFRSGPPDDESNTLDPVLRLDETACHFGGSRSWLLCPTEGCGRRSQSLFINECGRIACRKCLGLLYESQYGGRTEKKLTRLRAILRKVRQGKANRLSLTEQAQHEFLLLMAELKKSTV